MVSKRRTAEPSSGGKTIPVLIVDGSTTYRLEADANVQRFTVNDAPPFTPTSGVAQVRTRSDHAAVDIKDISDAFAHQIELAFENHGGHIDHLASSTMETRFGAIYLPPAENNPANAAATLSLMARPEATTAVRPGTITTPNYNPKMAKYFQGTTNTGVFLLRLDDDGGTPLVAEVECERWTGTAWANTLSDLMVAAGVANTGGYDLEIFQSSLCMLFNNNGTETVRYTTDGATSAAFTNQPSVNAAQGSRLKTFKALLWLFAQSGGAVTVQEQTSPTGGAAWATRGGAASLTGQLRDVDLFLQSDGTTQRIFVLTETGLYYWDETNYLFVFVKRLDAAGRAILPVNIQGKPALLLFMDAGRVQAFFADGTTWDLSPGGSQGMPSGMDFGVDSNGQVCITLSGRYVFALWSGKDTGGTVLAPLILALDLQDIALDARGKVRAGWHYIWQKADTSISAAASYIFVDPQSGDLVAGVQDATSEATTNIQLKKINVSPELQGTWDRKTSGVLTLPRSDFGSSLIPTTIWDMQVHSSGMGTGKSVAIAYRTNGSTGAYTTVATSTTDNSRVTFPANAATDVGVNASDVQIQLTFAGSAATDKIRWYDFTIGYTKVWPIRYIYILDFVLKSRPSLGQTAVKTMSANLATIQAIKTKVLLTYSKEVGQVVVQPLPESRILELTASGYAPSAPRTGYWRMVFKES